MWSSAIGAFKRSHEGWAQPLPLAPVNRMNGLIEIVAAPPYSGRAELNTLAKSLSLAINDLFPIAEALHILEFAEIKNGALKLTAAGNVFGRGDTDARKELLREHLLRFVPIIAHICRVLRERKGHRAPRMRFEAELEDHLTHRDAERHPRPSFSLAIRERCRGRLFPRWRCRGYYSIAVSALRFRHKV